MWQRMRIVLLVLSTNLTQQMLDITQYVRQKVCLKCYLSPVQSVQT